MIDVDDDSKKLVFTKLKRNFRNYVVNKNEFLLNIVIDNLKEIDKLDYHTIDYYEMLTLNDIANWFYSNDTLNTRILLYMECYCLREWLRNLHDHRS